MARLTTPAMWRRLPELAAACSLIVLVGCSDDVTPIVWPSPYLPRTSPANLLHNLQKAYERHDLAEYDSLLAQDFTFVLSMEDQQNPGMLDSWHKETELWIHAHMFDYEWVRTVALAFDSGDPAWDPTSGLYVAYASHVNLFVYGATPAQPAPLKEYRVTDGRERFYFRKNPWLAEGTRDSVWTIVRWEDDPTALRVDGAQMLVVPQTWGAVKWVFR